MRSLIVFMLISVSIGLQAQEYQLAKPLVQVKDGNFYEKTTSLRCELRLKGASIHYTLDGSEPTIYSPLYHKPIKIKWSPRVKIKAFKKGFIPSETVELRLFRVRSSPASITLSPQPGAPYDAQGEKTLTDRKAGSFNFRDGNWIGYNQGPVSIVFDIGSPSMKRLITLSTLTSPGSWIMNPDKITVEFSVNGELWKRPEEVDIQPVEEGDPAKKQFYTVMTIGYDRYVRFTIYPMGALPDWHPGKGQPGWVFIDEIFIQ